MATNRLPIVEDHTQGQRTTAYRTSSSEGADVPRCCGQCHPAVGGCVLGFIFNSPASMAGKPAGRYYVDGEGRECGTPPMVLLNGRWAREVETT